MVISGRSEFDIPQNCIHCGEQMKFGDQGIFWHSHSNNDFVICGDCAPSMIPALVKDLTNLIQFQKIKEHHAHYLISAAEIAKCYAGIIDDNA